MLTWWRTTIFPIHTGVQIRCLVWSIVKGVMAEAMYYVMLMWGCFIGVAAMLYCLTGYCWLHLVLSGVIDLEQLSLLLLLLRMFYASIWSWALWGCPLLLSLVFIYSRFWSWLDRAPLNLGCWKRKSFAFGPWFHVFLRLPVCVLVPFWFWLLALVVILFRLV